MLYLYLFSAAGVIVSTIVNREKTSAAFKIAFLKFYHLLPVLLITAIIVSVMLYAIPDELIQHYIVHNNKFTALLIASVMGSVTLMPGFIAFPMCGALLTKGVPYMILSAFTTTLMMVGIATYPLEKKYFGAKVTIIRNVASFFIALIVAVITGIFFGELF
ncbi:permease [bacterium]|nr:hypothetical protein [bacterium]MBU3955700.1 permease [bacterium]